MYFSSVFQIQRKTVEDYGAFDISLFNDLPLFVDPFLLFNSERNDYAELHEQIITYLRFLKDISTSGDLTQPLIDAWFRFPEVHQNWLGFTTTGNRGSGLGRKFAIALAKNLHQVFRDFGSEQVTRSSHLEKLCLIGAGVGRDNISDFTTNLIKKFLLEFTQDFCRQHLPEDKTREFAVSKVEFDYETRTWRPGTYRLPTFGNDFVILTPIDMLTRDETWISRPDMIGRFERVAEALPNDQLRHLLNDYLARTLPDNPKPKERVEAISRAILKYPEFIDHYIRYKEDHGDEAVAVSEEHVLFTKEELVENVESLSVLLARDLSRPVVPITSHAEAMDHVLYLKHVIEDNDGYRLFYVDGKPVETEHDLQLMFKLTWSKTVFDVNSEVNNGRGPVDFKISNGNIDKTLVEFKLARNRKLKQNLENQVEIYKAANDTNVAIKVIVYFTEQELDRLISILTQLEIEDDPNVVLIDARNDNKPSASVA